MAIHLPSLLTRSPILIVGRLLPKGRDMFLADIGMDDNIGIPADHDK